MKRKWVQFVLVFFFGVLVGQIGSHNNSSQTTVSPTPIASPTVVLGTTDTVASPSATIQKDRVKVTLIKVVDGDTIHVNFNGKDETVRIIGINTPETVDPRRPVECFGKEASNKARELFSNAKTIELEQDLSQDDRDKYQRLLRYVFLDGNDYGKQMISDGYAYEYTYEIPYRYQLDYKEAQKQAEDNKRGLWSDTACQSTSPTTAAKALQQNMVVTQPTKRPATVSQSQQSTSYSGDLNGDRDCKDFATQSQAQAYFKAKGGSPTYNADKLDSDGDGVACESLP